MSNETVVNRTPETFGQKLERERIEGQTAQEDRAAKIEELISAPVSVPVDVPASIDEAPETPFSPESELLSEALKITAAAPRDPDVKVLKAQVIAAFKHLGLDTRKFFGV